MSAMTDGVIVALISFGATLISGLIAVLVQNKVGNHKIEQVDRELKELKMENKELKSMLQQVRDEVIKITAKESVKKGG